MILEELAVLPAGFEFRMGNSTPERGTGHRLSSLPAPGVGLQQGSVVELA